MWIRRVEKEKKSICYISECVGLGPGRKKKFDSPTDPHSFIHLFTDTYLTLSSRARARAPSGIFTQQD